MKCFTTNCRIQVQNFGKHTRKEHLESVKEKALEFDKIFVPHLRAEIQRLQKRKIQDRVRKSSALDIDLKNVEAYGICSACQGYEHHHCAGTFTVLAK